MIHSLKAEMLQTDPKPTADMRNLKAFACRLWTHDEIHSVFSRVVEGWERNEMITLSIMPVNIFAFF